MGKESGKMMNKMRFIILFVGLTFMTGPIFAAETLAPGDSIHIWVKGEPELTVDRTIGSDGSIAFPLVGTVGVVGMSPRDAAKLIGRMLDDGYLRNPLVQIDRTVTGSSVPTSTRPSSPLSASSSVQKVVAKPLEVPGEARFDPVPVVIPEKPRQEEKIRVDIVDGKTGIPVKSAAMLLKGKIYQGNRLGQMILDSHEGQVILMADGYRVLQGNIEHYLRAGAVARILMDRILLAREVNVRIVDAQTNVPLPDVVVKLDGMRVKTNDRGSFRIKDILKEYGEIQLNKKGYKSLKRVLDFKDNSERVIPLFKN